MFAVPSFFGYNTTFVSTPVATAATGVGETSFTANWNAFVGASYYLLDVSTSSSFSSFVGSYQNFVVLSTSQLVSGLTASTTYYYRLRAATGVDADAAAFFSRVYTAGGALSYTEVSATETLVSSLKANSLWTPMKAIYPMIGASAAACAQNLKSSSFTGTFTSGWTFASTGVTPNGTSAYMDTSFNPNTQLTFDSAHISYYSRTNNEFASSSTMGVNDVTNNEIRIILRRPTNTGFFISTDNTNGVLTYTITDSRGLFIGNANGVNVRKYFRNSTLLTPNSASSRGLGVWPNFPIYIGSRNNIGTASEFDNKECSFSSIGDGLTDTQASNFYTAVQAFQTTLVRQV